MHSVPVWLAKSPSVEEKMFTWVETFSQIVEKAGAMTSVAIAAAPHAVV